MRISISLSIDDLLKEYQSLLTKQSNNTIQLEQEKLVILELLLEKLQFDSSPPIQYLKENEAVDTPFKARLRRISYYILLAFGVCEDAANSFFFGSALFFSLFPSISNSALFLASIIYVCIESTLFYIYDAAELKDALGLQDPHTSLSPLITLYSKQLKTATALNQQLAMISALTMNSPLFLSYVELIALINQDLKRKHNMMENMEESLWKKIIRCSVFLFGAISSLTGSYFMATTLMSLLYVSLLGTPLGLGITVLTMIIGVVFHYAMDTTSLTRVVNPDYEKFNTLKEELQLFDQTFSEDLAYLKRLRQRFEKKSVVNQGVQTDEVDLTPLTQKEALSTSKLSSQSFFKLTMQNSSQSQAPHVQSGFAY